MKIHCSLSLSPGLCAVVFGVQQCTAVCFGCIQRSLHMSACVCRLSMSRWMCWESARKVSQLCSTPRTPCFPKSLCWSSGAGAESRLLTNPRGTLFRGQISWNDVQRAVPTPWSETSCSSPYRMSGFEVKGANLLRMLKCSFTPTQWVFDT